MTRLILAGLAGTAVFFGEFPLAAVLFIAAWAVDRLRWQKSLEEKIEALTGRVAEQSRMLQDLSRRLPVSLS